MKGDFSRDSFARSKPFSRVLMQQGRVLLDADWNEQTRLVFEHIRTLTGDLLGPGAGPSNECGFRLVSKANFEAVLSAEGALSAQEQECLAQNRAAIDAGDLLLLPGRYYVGGIPVELRQGLLYSAQPGYPFDGATVTQESGSPGSNWVAYLDVWEDFIGPDEDPSLADPALGGTEANGRGVIRWQVRLLPTSGRALEDFERFRTRPIGRLSAWTEGSDGIAPTDPLGVAGYSGLEDRLYRIEIHRRSGAEGQDPTFKWSRDNGSCTYPVEHIAGSQVHVTRWGRDDFASPRPGDWLELCGETVRGHDPGGLFGRVTGVHLEDRTLTVDWADPQPGSVDWGAGEDRPRPVLRRWDQKGDLREHGGALPLICDTDLELEDGIFIRFFQDGGAFPGGQYWTIPARRATANVLWPRLDGRPERRLPDGPKHFYAEIAALEGGLLTDLRKSFEPLGVRMR